MDETEVVQTVNNETIMATWAAYVVISATVGEILYRLSRAVMSDTSSDTRTDYMSTLSTPRLPVLSEIGWYLKEILIRSIKEPCIKSWSINTDNVLHYTGYLGSDYQSIKLDVDGEGLTQYTVFIVNGIDYIDYLTSEDTSTLIYYEQIIRNHVVGANKAKDTNELQKVVDSLDGKSPVQTQPVKMPTQKQMEEDRKMALAIGDRHVQQMKQMQEEEDKKFLVAINKPTPEVKRPTTEELHAEIIKALESQKAQRP